MKNRKIIATEGNWSVLGINARSAFENLHNGLLARYFQNLATAFGAVSESKVHDLGITRELPLISASGIEFTDRYNLQCFFNSENIIRLNMGRD